MTREQLKKHWKEIEAYKNGAKIECKQDFGGGWRIISNPTWDIELEYRIKPQSEYVPFDFSDAEKLIGKTIKSKDGRIIAQITLASNNVMAFGGEYMLYSEYFDKYLFLDGTPCGKLKQ